MIECGKLAQKKCKTRQDWVGKGIHMELLGYQNLTILANDICENQNLSKKIRPIKFSGIMKYEGIIQSRPED